MNIKIHEKLEHLIRHPLKDWDSSKDLKFQIVDWFSQSIGDDECKNEIEKMNEENEEDGEKDEGAFNNRCVFRDPRKHEISLFGVTRTGESVCAKVQDYKPFFYLKLPKGNGNYIAREFYTLLQKKNYAHKFNNSDKSEKPHFHPWTSGIVGMNFLERYDLDAGFTNKEKFSFLEITFANNVAMKKCISLIRNFQAPYNNNDTTKRYESNDDKKLKNICKMVKLYESNIDPMLRFMHLRDIQSTGWAVLKGGTYKYIEGEDRESTCQIEASVKWDKVEPDNEDNSVAPIRQASFDIECYSHDRKFPKPEDIQNKCIQIATAIKDYGSKDFTIKHILALGPCNEIEGAIVDVCETESELLCKWALLLQKLDPDVLIGYNIFGFDLNYVMVRAEKLGVLDKFAFMAKLSNYKCVITKKELKSKAYGANYYLMVEMPGRFQLDLYPHIKKEQKYVSYKLDYVAEQILGDRKHDVSPKEISDGFASGDVDRITRIAAYCIQDTLLPQLIIDKMNILLNLIEMGKVTYVPLSYLINRGQQIKVFSHVAKTARLSGYLMAHIFQERPQDGDIKRLKTERIFADEDADEDEEEDEETYEGATVLEPDVGFYDEPIACLDFMSLYPTIEIDWNLDYASLVKDYFKYGRIPNVPYHSVFIPVPPPDDSPEPSPVWSKLRITLFEATGKIYLNFVGSQPPADFIDKLKRFNGFRQELGDLYVPYICKANDHDDTKYNSKDNPQWSVPYAPNTMKFLYRTFAGATTRKLYLWGENFQGLIPKVLVHLLGARSKAKKQQEDATDPFMKSVFEGKQLALKVCCNSVYGFTGAVKSGMLPCKPIAECTTTIGRWMIESSRDFAQNIDNFRDITRYTTVFPDNYPYICRNVVDPAKPKFYLTDIKGIVSKSFKNWKGELDDKIWDYLHDEFSERSDNSITFPLIQTAKGTFDIYTTEGFSSIKSVTIENDPFKEGMIVYRLNTEKGQTISINQFAVKDFKNENGECYHAHVVYGDTDSIFTKFSAPQFSTLEKKIAYNMICGSYAADRITEFLRSKNRFKDEKNKWTTLQYEKVYGMLLMFSKKRYAGTLFSTNPCKYAYIDKKGVALKRRDFCILVKEIYGDCLKILFDESLGEPRIRLEIAIARAKTSIEDLLNHRVPIEKLELSNLLNDEYKMREQKVKKDKKFVNTFNENNIFINDLIVIEHHKYGLIEGKVVAKRGHDMKHFFDRKNYRTPLDVYFKVESENDGQSVIEFQGKLEVDYGDIKSKSGFSITLKKILDPLTDERELMLVTQAHVRLARKMFLRDAGSAPCSGERVPFVYVESNHLPEDCLQWQKAEHPLYAQENNLKLDVLYYLEHQLRTPITQIFSLIMKDPDSLFDGLVIDYKNKQKKQASIEKWFTQTPTNISTNVKQNVSAKRTEREEENIGTEIDDQQSTTVKKQKLDTSKKATTKTSEFKITKNAPVKNTGLKQTGLSGWLKK